MKSLLRPVAHQYRSWMDRWENELCFRANDRVIRPFEYGFEWSERWPCSATINRNGSDPLEYLVRLSDCCIANSAEFFGYRTPPDFELSNDWIEFSSPVETPYPENNKARARWFPARTGGRKAVVVLPTCRAPSKTTPPDERSFLSIRSSMKRGRYLDTLQWYSFPLLKEIRFLF